MGITTSLETLLRSSPSVAIAHSNISDKNNPSIATSFRPQGNGSDTLGLVKKLNSGGLSTHFKWRLLRSAMHVALLRELVENTLWTEISEGQGLKT
jgi:hypothetical protein